MGLFSFVGSLIGGGSAKKASRKAEAAQLDALNRGVEEQRRQFDLTRTDFSPYREQGLSALSGMGNLLGTGGADAQATALAGLRDSPLFHTTYDTGEEAILQNAAATGGIRGGNTERGLADFGADTFSRVLMQQLQSLGGLANMGLGATDSTAGFGQQTANNVTNLFGQQGDTRASGLLTRGGINAQLWNNAGGFLDSVAGGGGGQKGGGLASIIGSLGKVF